MTLPSWARLGLGIAFLGMAAMAYADDQAWLPVAFLAMGLLFVHAWVRYADVPRASRAYNRGNRERAFELLEKTPAGGRFLAREYRIYYHQVRSRCLMGWGRYSDAVPEAQQVLRLDATERRHAASHTDLAQAYVNLGQREKAAEHLAAARNLDHTKALDRRLAEVAELLGAG